MTRDVYKLMAIMKSMRMYNITVFFAMRLLSPEVCMVGCVLCGTRKPAAWGAAGFPGMPSKKMVVSC